MIIIHGVNNFTKPRFVAESLAQRLKVVPAVVITGSRQTGKSTLVQEMAPGARDYFTLDDLDTLELVQNRPDELLGGKRPITLDEVQRTPDLMRAIKRAIDQKRSNGQFLLTGSANLLLMKRVSESLAGRASYLTLWPLTRREQLGAGSPGCWDELLETDPADWEELIHAKESPKEDWRALAKRGGFPTPSLHLKTSAERSIWFEGYTKTYLERDLQDLSSISGLPDFRRLMRACSIRLGQITNQTKLGQDVGIPQATVHRYLNLLETSYMLVRLPAYSVNRTKRIVKSPKLFWGDVGLALHLSDNPSPSGPHLENLILHDLLAWRDSRLPRAEIYYWRTVQGDEVDLVVESEGKLLPIEVKSSARPKIADTKHLSTFREEHPDHCLPGVVLHTGSKVEWLTPNSIAIPWWKVL